jgi:hypothetical protein
MPPPSQQWCVRAPHSQASRTSTGPARRRCAQLVPSELAAASLAAGRALLFRTISRAPRRRPGANAHERTHVRREIRRRLAYVSRYASPASLGRRPAAHRAACRCITTPAPDTADGASLGSPRPRPSASLIAQQCRRGAPRCVSGAALVPARLPSDRQTGGGLGSWCAATGRRKG